jgi:N-acetyl sugar amidotransferase
MKYCKNCLETNTRPKSKFDKNGFCKACVNYKIKKNKYNQIDKIRLIKNVIKKYPKKKSSFYDCVVGVSGGKDSLRQALWIRDKLGLKPLLVCGSYPPEQITKIGADNLSNIINQGFDLIVSAPGPKTWKKILKKGFVQGNYLRGPELLLYSSVPQIAIKYNINLIFWGENPADNWNDSGVKTKNEFDGNSLRNLNTLKDCKLDWMKECISSNTNLIPYTYPSVSEFKKNKIQIIFLGAFWRNWSIESNASFSITHGLKIRTDNVKNTGDLYGVMALDDNWLSINQMIKYYKYGFGRVSEYLNYEIREGKTNRRDAIKVAEKYDGACSETYINNFCKYLDISKDEFNKILSGFVNKDLFTISNSETGKKYIRKFQVGKGI